MDATVQRQKNAKEVTDEQGPKINQIIYMDDIKIFAKNEKELETITSY